MVIMARLLAPADFGLVALAAIFLQFGTYFAQLGVGQALMQRLTLSDKEIRTAFTTSVLLGVLLATLFYLAAPFAEMVVDAPEVVPVIQVLALTLVITGMGVTAHSLLKRELRFRGLAIVEVGSYVIGYVFVGITLAVLGFGVWSLVFAALCQALLQTITVYAMTRHVSRPFLGWPEIKRLYGYGGKYSVTQFLNMTRNALVHVAVGRVAGVAVLGLFDRAKMLVQLPFDKLETTINKVLFPAMSKVQEDTQALARIFLLQKALVAGFVLPTLAGMAVSADILILVLLGPQWADAARIVPLLAIAVGFLFLGHFARVVADVKALMNQRIAIESAHLVMLAAGLFVGAQYGLGGLLVGIIAAEALAYLAYERLMRLHLLISWRELGKALGPGAVIATPLVGVGLAISNDALADSGLPPFVVLLSQLLLGGTFLTVLWMSPLFHSIRTECFSLALTAENTGGSQRLTGPANRLRRLLLGQR